MATARRAGRENLLDEGSLDHAIYLALYRWRDATARAADEGVGPDTLQTGANPTPLALAAPHAALASLVAPAALPAPVRLRAAEVVGVVVGAVRGWQGKAGSKGIEKAGAVGQQKVEKGEMEVAETTKEQQEEEGKVVETTSAIKTTPTPTSALFGRKPSTAASTSSTSVAASSSSLFGGALGARAASSSLSGNTTSSSGNTTSSSGNTTSSSGNTTSSSTTTTASTTVASAAPGQAAASRSALFGGTLRNAASSTKVPSPTVAATPSLASIAARVHASFGVMPAAPALDADTSALTNLSSGASTAEHAFVPSSRRQTASVTVFSSVKKSTGLTEAERKALADAEDDAMDEDADSSSADDAAARGKTGQAKKDKKGKSSKDKNNAAPSVAADAIVAGAGARQKKRKRTKGPTLDLSGETSSANPSTSTSAQAASADASNSTTPDAPFDFASVPNILDGLGPSTTPMSERPRKKKRKAEEKGPHFRAPAPAPAEVRGVKVNLAHTFGK
ncbi:hypothetical protein GGF50DRAFT_130709 [Schizophyllum commune]